MLTPRVMMGDKVVVKDGDWSWKLVPGCVKLGPKMLAEEQIFGRDKFATRSC